MAIRQSQHTLEEEQGHQRQLEQALQQSLAQQRIEEGRIRRRVRRRSTHESDDRRFAWALQEDQITQQRETERLVAQLADEDRLAREDLTQRPWMRHFESSSDGMVMYDDFPVHEPWMHQDGVAYDSQYGLVYG